MAQSPITRLIDATMRCTKCDAPMGTCACWDPPARPDTTTLTDLAYAAAMEVLHHIDTMYPAMWVGVPKTARLSVRNTIIRVVTQALKDAQES